MVDMSVAGFTDWASQKASAAKKTGEQVAGAVAQAGNDAVEAGEEFYTKHNQDSNFTAAGALDSDSSGQIEAGEKGFDAMKRAGADANRNGSVDSLEAKNFVLNLMDQQGADARRMLGFTEEESTTMHDRYERVATRQEGNTSQTAEKKNAVLKDNGIAAAKSGFFDVAWQSQEAITDASVRSTVARAIVEEQAQHGQLNDAISNLHFIEKPADRAEAVGALAQRVAGTKGDESSQAQFAEIRAFIQSEMKNQPVGRNNALANLSYAEAKAGFPGRALTSAHEIQDPEFENQVLASLTQNYGVADTDAEALASL
jgi:hypothetical protein